MFYTDEKGEQHELAKFDQAMGAAQALYQQEGASQDPAVREKALGHQYDFLKKAVLDKDWLAETLRGKTLASIDIVELGSLTLEIEYAYQAKIFETMERVKKLRAALMTGTVQSRA